MEKETPEFYNDLYIKENCIDFRHYQINIVKTCKKKNSLVVLPTGLGKTIIAILMVSNRLKDYSKRGKILILAPTRPLVSQHLSTCNKYLKFDENEIISLTGKISPQKRTFLFKNSRIIISTPQVIKNDLIRGRYNLSEIMLLIFDEAHRTRGNYAYNFISKYYIQQCTDPLILGLTASPGKNFPRIQELCDNLYLENIVFKTFEDEDVQDYIYDIDIFLEPIDLTIKLIEISQIIEDLFRNFLRFFFDRNLLNPYKNYYSKLDFLNIARDLTYSLKYDDLLNLDEFIEELHFQEPKIIDIVRNSNLNIHSIFSYCSSCISLLHSKELLETQDITLFQQFLEKVKYKSENENLSSKRIINSEHFKLINSIVKETDIKRLKHPKIDKILSLIDIEFSEYQNKKIVIFTQYREMADLLKETINEEFKGELVVEKFIGQTTKIDDPGFTQYEQIDILKRFREGSINILTATSVAEEGLDVPNVDAIIFYEPVASEIKHIQRRGRTGRHSSGRCYIMMAKDSVDVPFFKAAEKKEETMNEILYNPSQLELSSKINRQKISFQEKSLSEFDIIQKFRERKAKEKELLVNKSIEEILNKIDHFNNSKKYDELKEQGVTFFSDICTINKKRLKSEILKIKGKKPNNKNERKRYLNNNVKTLINLVKTYSDDNFLNITRFKELAAQEDIIDQKFFIHYNRACDLGYLKDYENKVEFIKDINQ